MYATHTRDTLSQLQYDFLHPPHSTHFSTCVTFFWFLGFNFQVMSNTVNKEIKPSTFSLHERGIKRYYVIMIFVLFIILSSPGLILSPVCV